MVGGRRRHLEWTGPRGYWRGPQAGYGAEVEHRTAPDAARLGDTAWGMGARAPSGASGSGTDHDGGAREGGERSMRRRRPRPAHPTGSGRGDQNDGRERGPHRAHVNSGGRTSGSCGSHAAGRVGGSARETSRPGASPVWSPACARGCSETWPGRLQSRRGEHDRRNSSAIRRRRSDFNRAMKLAACRRSVEPTPR